MASRTHCKTRALAGLALGTAAPATLMALPDAAGPGIGAIAIDISGRKRAEARRTIGLCQDGGKRGR